jgi:hypothetical protein
MIKKSEKCLYCGIEMESKTAKKKFCSTKCRVYWNRENPRKGVSLFDETVNSIWSVKDVENLKNIVSAFNANVKFSDKERALLKIHVKRVGDDKNFKL